MADRPDPDPAKRPSSPFELGLPETDETRATFFRGVLRFATAIVGHRADQLEDVRRSAGALARGLVFRTEHEVGITGGL